MLDNDDRPSRRRRGKTVVSNSANAEKARSVDSRHNEPDRPTRSDKTGIQPGTPILQENKALAINTSQGDVNPVICSASVGTRSVERTPSVDQTSVNSSATTDSRVPEDSSTFQDGRVLNWLGVSVNQQVDYGRWSEQEASLHINVLELLGILKGLQTFASRLQGRNVIICGDITTSLAYMRKMGGIKSPIMSEMTVNIWELAQKYHIYLIVEHAPGESNQEADHLSRLFQSDKTEAMEWRLNKNHFNRIQSECGPMGTDLFASHLNAQLLNYIPWKEDHHKMDAFHYQWQDGDYGFPPFAVISPALCNVRRDKNG